MRKYSVSGLSVEAVPHAVANSGDDSAKVFFPPVNPFIYYCMVQIIERMTECDPLVTLYAHNL